MQNVVAHKKHYFIEIDMKKALLILAAVLIIPMLVSNTSQTDLLTIIDNSKDPLSEYYMVRTFKNASAIYNSSEEYFSPVFDMSFTNLGIFSIANIKHGWMGTLKINGTPTDKFCNLETNTTFLLIFGKEIEVSESTERNF